MHKLVIAFVSIETGLFFVENMAHKNIKGNNFPICTFGSYSVGEFPRYTSMPSFNFLGEPAVETHNIYLISVSECH